MSDRAKLVWVWAVASFAAGLLLWVLTFVCENIGEEAAQTVRCDGERGRSKPAPRLSAVCVLDRRCAEPCAAGIRVAFTLDRTARMRFGLGPDDNSSVEYRPSRESSGYGYRSGVVRKAWRRSAAARRSASLRAVGWNGA